jgi:hypothetical protein
MGSIPGCTRENARTGPIDYFTMAEVSLTTGKNFT